jgi:hypothetical protein
LKERQKKNLTESQRVHNNVRQVNLILSITAGSRILTISEFREPLVMGFENEMREREPKNRRFLLKESMGSVEGPAKNQWFCGQ